MNSTSAAILAGRMAECRRLITEFAEIAGVRVVTSGDIHHTPSGEAYSVWEIVAPASSADWPPHLKALRCGFVIAAEEVLPLDSRDLAKMVKLKWVSAIEETWRVGLVENFRAYEGWLESQLSAR